VFDADADVSWADALQAMDAIHATCDTEVAAAYSRRKECWLFAFVPARHCGSQIKTVTLDQAQAATRRRRANRLPPNTLK
jgi:hypothetical protein